MQEANDLLEKYKKRPFATGLIPFRAAVRSIKERFSKVYAKMDGRQRWTMCDQVTGEPVIFSHAAVFVESDDQETGNLVPDGEVVPPGVDSKSVQRRPNMKCFYTYIFDTFTDTSLYEGQWALDEYMGTVKGFNEGRLPRRSYLSGLDPRYRSRFWMQTPMFLRRGNKDARSTPPEHLHTWVTKAETESKGFRANPDRPRVWIKVGDAILPIAERTPPTLQRGDVVAISFTVTYHVTTTNWFPQFHPVDLVVVKDGDLDTTDYSAPALDLYSRPPPTLQAIPEEDEAMEDVQHTTTPVTPEGPSPMNEDADQRPGEGGDEDLAKHVNARVQETMDVDTDTSRVAAEKTEVNVKRAGSVERGDEEDEARVLDGFVEVTGEEKRETRATSSRANRNVRRRLTPVDR